MSDTPRTDKEAIGFARIIVDRNFYKVTEIISADFARQLEKEVGLLEHDIEIQNKQLSDCWVKIKSLESEVRNLRAMRDVIYGVKRST